MKNVDKEISDQIKLGDVVIKAKPKPGCCRKFCLIYKRNGTACRRNPIVFKARVGQNMFLGIVTALIFQNAGTKCFPPDEGGVSTLFLTKNHFFRLIRVSRR